MKDFEKKLNEKMSELSDNVDCFDKISKRAYHTQNEFTEDGFYSESQLENITGKRKFRFAPVITAVFAVAVCSFTLMQDSVKEYLYNITSQNQDYSTYSDIKAELDSELQNYTYSYSDYSFEEYKMNSACINPFAYHELNTHIDNTNVRIYTKIFTVGKEQIETNQMYIVLYAGEYCDENIISITDSAAKISSDDRDRATNQPVNNVSWDILFPETYSNTFIPENPADNALTPFEIGYRCFFKDGETTYDLYTSTLFCFSDSDNNKDTKHYSSISVYNDGSGDIVIDTPENRWNETVYQGENIEEAFIEVNDENTGFSDESEPLFIKENITPNIVNEFTGYDKNVFLSPRSTFNEEYSNQYGDYYRYDSNTCERTFQIKFNFTFDHKTDIIYDYAYTTYINSKENQSQTESDNSVYNFDFQTFEMLYNNCKELSYEKVSFSDVTDYDITLNEKLQQIKENQLLLQMEIQKSELEIPSEEFSEDELAEIESDIATKENKLQENYNELNKYEQYILSTRLAEYLELNYGFSQSDISNVYTHTTNQYGIRTAKSCEIISNYGSGKMVYTKFERADENSDWNLTHIKINASTFWNF